MEIPKGISITKGKNLVFRLKKGLYGLKQASRNWNFKFIEFLKTFEMKQSIADPCVFYGSIENNKIILLLYVDDGLIMSPSKRGLQIFLDALSKTFRITYGEHNYYVGLEIHRDRLNKSIKINQYSYIKKILRKFNMDDANTISTPSDCNTYLTKSTDEDEVQYPFRQAVGSLMFAAIVSRPDISYAVGEVSKFTDSPRNCHVHALKRIFRYLKATMSHYIEYKSNNSFKFEGFTDADFARDIDTRRSTTGYVFLINDSAITWRSHRQKTVALSTTEAECMAACEGAKEALWLQQLLADIGYFQNSPTVLNVDNQGAIRLIGNPELHHSTKHIDIRIHFIRDLQKNKTIEFKYVNTELQRADILTKPLTIQRFKNNLHLLGMLELKQ